MELSWVCPHLSKKNFSFTKTHLEAPKTKFFPVLKLLSFILAKEFLLGYVTSSRAKDFLVFSMKIFESFNPYRQYIDQTKAEIIGLIVRKYFFIKFVLRKLKFSNFWFNFYKSFFSIVNFSKIFKTTPKIFVIHLL